MKYVWETAKRGCDFITAHEDLINITTFGEYRRVMLKVMRVIKADNVERKRRQTKRTDECDEVKKTMQRAKALISDIKAGVERQEIERRLEPIFGKGSREEIAKATTDEKIVERVTELSRREERFEVWEKRRSESKRDNGKT